MRLLAFEHCKMLEATAFGKLSPPFSLVGLYMSQSFITQMLSTSSYNVKLIRNQQTWELSIMDFTEYSVFIFIGNINWRPSLCFPMCEGAAFSWLTGRNLVFERQLFALNVEHVQDLLLGAPLLCSRKFHWQSV